MQLLFQDPAVLLECSKELSKDCSQKGQTRDQDVKEDDRSGCDLQITSQRVFGASVSRKKASGTSMGSRASIYAAK
jgi:hypothetical protein